MNESGIKRAATIAAGVTLTGFTIGALRSAADRVTHLTSERSITIGADAPAVYAAWRERIATAVEPYANVTTGTDGRLEWELKPPLDALTWETFVVEERPNEFLRWESPDAKVPFEGSIELRQAPKNRGTEVTLRVTGPIPEPLAGIVLRRFKALLEAGEVPTLEHNPSARAPKSSKVEA